MDKDRVSELVLELIIRKKDLVTKMLTTTQSLEFCGDATEDTENFVNTIKQREECIEQIKSIDEQLQKPVCLEVLANPDEVLERNIKAADISMKEDINKITEIEKNNAPKIEKMKNEMVKHMKHANTAKNMRAVYQTDTDYFSQNSIDTKH